MSADLFSWSENLHILNNRGDLSVEQVQWAMREILDGRASNDEIKSFLLALKAKGESALEVNALVEEMYRHAAPISIIKRAVDTVIRGDGAPPLNISTTSAIIAAAAAQCQTYTRASSNPAPLIWLEVLGVAITLDGIGGSHYCA